MKKICAPKNIISGRLFLLLTFFVPFNSAHAAAGLASFDYTNNFEVKDIDPSDALSTWSGAAYNAGTNTIFLTDAKVDKLVETDLNGTIRRTIDISSFNKPPDSNTGAKAITWMGGQRYGIVFENQNVVAVVTIDNVTTSLSPAGVPIYKFPPTNASSVASLAYRADEDAIYFINSKPQQVVFKAQLNSDGKTMTVLNSFDASAWNVGRIEDIAFDLQVTDNLLVLTREDPLLATPLVPPLKMPQVMEVVVKQGVPGYQPGAMVGQMNLVYTDIPQPGGLTFDNQNRMYVMSGKTSNVKGEKTFTRFDPTTVAPLAPNRKPVASIIPIPDPSPSPLDEGNLITLDASRSSDPDGDNLTFTWAQTAGPSNPLNTTNPQKPTVIPVVSGDSTLTYQLTLDDLKGGITKASINIPVTNINVLPAVSLTNPISGSNFIAPANITLAATATDSDGTISRVDFYSSGIKINTTPSTLINGQYTYTWNSVAAGTYNLNAKAFDNNGGPKNSSPLTPITVNPPTATNLPPAVSAGPDTTITLPQPAPLSGTMTDDGLPVGGSLNCVWNKVSGPGTVIFGNANVAATLASFSSAGTYVLSFGASDSSLIASDDVTVTVNAAPVNQPPTVSITSPLTGSNVKGTVTVKAIASDSDGTISQVDFYVGTIKLYTATAPDSFGFYSMDWYTPLNPDGPYTVKAIATDNLGATTNSTPITLVVSNVVVNQPPTVSIAAPLNGVTVKGTVTVKAVASDPDGTIAKVDFYVGVGVSPPTLLLYSDQTADSFGYFSMDWYTLLNSNGAYTVKAVATDNSGAATNSAPITLNVLNLTNQAPKVNAGADTSIYLPNSVSLNGTVSDDGLPNGSTAISWTMVTGPGTVTFGNANAAAITASFSAAGTYTLRLTASDGSLSSSDDVVVTVQPALVFGTGLNSYNYAMKFGLNDIDPAGTISSWSGAAYNAVTDTIFMVDAKTDVVVETDLNGKVLRTIDFSSFNKPPDTITAAKAITWMGGQRYGIVLENQNVVAVVTIDNVTTSLSPTGVPLYKFPNTNASSVASLAYRVDEDAIYFINSKSPMTVFKAQLNSDGKTMTVLNSFDAAALWNVQKIEDLAFAPQVSDNLLVLTREDPATGATAPTQSAKVMEVVVKQGVPGHQQGDIVGKLDLSFASSPQPGGLTFDSQKRMYVLSGTTKLVQKENTFSRFDPTVGVPNLAPVANAGTNATITLPQTASLTGSATDDGLPTPPGVVTFIWSKVSGVGSVTFTDASAAATSASFSTAGTYVLRLTASDSSLSSSADVTITVNPSNVPNQAPMVNAGLDMTNFLPNAANLTGIVSDDGLPSGSTTINWTVVTGAGTVTFGNANSAATTASFSALGNYTLRLSATDGSLSALDDVNISVQPALVFGTGLASYNYARVYGLNAVDPSGNLSSWSGAAYNAVTNTIFLVDAKVDKVVETDLNGTILRTIDISALVKPPDTITAAKAITWMGGQQYGIVLENQNVVAVVTIDNQTTVLNPAGVPLYKFPSTNASSVASLAYRADENAIYFINSKSPMTVFKAQLNADGKTMTVLNSFDAAALWNVQKIEDLAFAPQVSDNLLVLTREDPATGATAPTQPAKVMEVVVKQGVPGHQQGDVVGQVTLVYTDTPQPGGLTFDSQRRMYVLSGTTKLVQKENTFVRFDPTTGVPNLAPVANAGPNATITLPQTASLTGSATDDKLPSPPGVVTFTWSKVSGVGSVTFADASAAATSASFSTAGTYVLRLTASDSSLTSSADVTITVNPSNLPNQAPKVNAGLDLTNYLPNAANLLGTVSDDGLPSGSTTINWTVVSGAGTVTFGNVNSAATTASFSALGNYTLRLSATDGALSALDDVNVNVQPALVFGTGLNSYNYAMKFGLNDIDPAGTISSWSGAAYNAITNTIFMTDAKTDVVIETDLNGKVLRTIDISSFNKPPDTITAAKAITWMGGQQYGISLENQNVMAVVTIDNTTTSLNPAGAMIYKFPSTGASSIASLAYRTDENAIYFINGKAQQVVFKAQLDPVTKTMTVVDSFDATTLWNVQRVEDLAFAPQVSDNLLVLTREDPATGATAPTQLAKVMEVVVKPGVVGKPQGTVVGQMDLAFTNSPQPGGLTFDSQRRMYVLSGTTKLVQGENTFSRFDPTSGVPNLAPVANAGTNATITLPQTASLTGSATDDKLPNPPGVVTFTWSKVSGAGSVTFADATAAATSASFSTAGIYVLRLTASDSSLSSSADVTITVNPSNLPNQAPTVNAGLDLTNYLPNAANLLGTVSDDGLPSASTTINWTVLNTGAGTVTFGNMNSAATTASFSAPGNYTLRLSASDGLLSSLDDVNISVQPALVFGTGLTSYNYQLKYGVIDIDPAGVISSWSGAAYNAVTNTIFLVDAKVDKVVETDLNGTILRTIDISAFVKPPDTITAAKSITWMGGQQYGIVLENQNVVAVVTIDNQATSLSPTGVPLYKFPSTGASSVASLAYRADENAIYFINSKAQQMVFKAQLNADGKTMTVVDSFDATALWNVQRVEDLAFAPQVSDNLLVLTREDPVPPATAPAKQAQVMEVVVKTGVPGHQQGDIVGKLDLSFTNIPQPGGLTFDSQRQMYVLSGTTPLVKKEFTFARLDPTTNLGNQAPVVNAGPDTSITLQSTNLNGTMTDDGLPLGGNKSCVWSQVSGPGIVAFANANTEVTSADFPSAGTYILRLSGTDGSLVSADDVTVTVQGAPVVVGPGLASYNYAKAYELKDVDPNGIYKEWGGIAYNPVTNTLFMAEDTLDKVVETDLNGTILRVIDISAFNKPPDTNTAAKAITWMGGQRYGIVLENRNAVAVVTIDNTTTALSATGVPVYDLPASGAQSVASLAYRADEDAIYFINNKPPLMVFKAQLNSDGKTMTVLNSFDATAMWNVSRIGDIAFAPKVSDNLLVLTREDPVPPATTPVQAAKVMEVVVKQGISGHPQGQVLGQVPLVFTDIPQPGGLSFDGQGKMYITSGRTSLVQGEKGLTRFDPSTNVTNLAPVVNAGVDATVTLPQSANLSGTITDDGLPNPPATVTPTWSLISGAGTVAFGNANTVNTNATFPSVGTYVLRLSATDGSLTSSDDITITVNPASAINQSPVVNAGSDSIINLPNPANLSGTMTDDGLPNGSATVTWSVISGAGTVVFANANSATTLASFITAGTYTLRLSATDGSLSSSDDVIVTAQPPLVFGTGLASYNYTKAFEVKDVDPNGIYKEWGGIAFNSVTNTLFMVDDTIDKVVETDLNGTILRVIDISSFNKPPDLNTGAKAITWMGGQQYGIVFENRNAVAIVTIDNTTTSLSATGVLVYDLPSTNASSVASLAYRSDENAIYFINSKAPQIVFKAQFNSDGKTMTVLNSFDATALWGVSKVTDLAFAPQVSDNLLVLTREDPVPPATTPAKPAQVMEVVVKTGVPGHQQGDIVAKINLVYVDIPQPGGLTFDTQRRMYVVSSKTSSVQGEKGLTRFDPTTVATNQAPVVNAGVDATITLPQSANLSGTISDDGFPNPPGSTMVTWSEISGPGTVAFGFVNAANTNASFSAVGTYVLRLSATDGSLSSSDDVTVTVNPASGINQAPVVNAGADTIDLTLFQTTYLSGTMTDDGLPNPPGAATVNWSMISGQGTVTFGNPNSVGTDASFSANGTYVLRLSATDGSLSSFADVTVTVKVPSPTNGLLLAGYNFNPILGVDLDYSAFVTPPVTLSSTNFSGICYSPPTQTFFVTDTKGDRITEIQSDGTILRMIDISALKSPDPAVANADPEGMTWVRGQTYAVILGKGEELAIVDITPTTTSLGRGNGTVYKLSGDPKGIAYSARDNSFYWVNQDNPMLIVQGRINQASGNVDILRQINLDGVLPVDSLTDVAFFPRISPNLFLLSNISQTIMEVDINESVPNLKSSFSISLPAWKLPDPQGLAFGPDGKIYVVGKHVKGVGQDDLVVFGIQPSLVNQAPWIFARVPNQAFGDGNGNALIIVDASASYDPDDDLITRYKWMIDSTATLYDGPNAATTLSVNSAALNLSNGPHSLNLYIYSPDANGNPQLRSANFAITIDFDQISPNTFPQTGNTPAVNYIHPGSAVQQAEFAFDLSSTGHAQIRIFDPLGREVKKIESDEVPPGSYVEPWDLKNEDGTTVSAGVYFALISTPGQTRREKVVVVR